MDLISFRGICILKNQLLNMDAKKIVDAYDTYESYEELMWRIHDLMEFEPSFIHILGDRNIIYDIIAGHRFDFYQVGDVNDVINSNIGTLNSAYYQFDTAVDSVDVVAKYWEQQEEVHQLDFVSQEDFFRTESIDICVLNGLIDGDVSRFEDVDFFGTICYCLESVPELFTVREIKSIVDNRLDKIKVPEENVKKVKQLINTKIDKINSKKS